MQTALRHLQTTLNWEKENGFLQRIEHQTNLSLPRSNDQWYARCASPTIEQEEEYLQSE